MLPRDFDVPVDLWVLVNRDPRGSGPVHDTCNFILRETVKDSDLFRDTAQ